MMLAVVSAQRSDGGTCSGDVGREMWGHEAHVSLPHRSDGGTWVKPSARAYEPHAVARVRDADTSSAMCSAYGRPLFAPKSTAFGTSTTQRSPVRPFESVPSDAVRGARKVARDASASAAMPVPVVGDVGCDVWGHVLRRSGDAGTVGRQRVRGDGRRRRVQRLRPRPRFGARRGRDHLADLAQDEGGGVRLHT